MSQPSFEQILEQFRRAQQDQVHPQHGQQAQGQSMEEDQQQQQLQSQSAEQQQLLSAPGLQFDMNDIQQVQSHLPEQPMDQEQANDDVQPADAGGLDKPAVASSQGTDPGQPGTTAGPGANIIDLTDDPAKEGDAPGSEAADHVSRRLPRRLLHGLRSPPTRNLGQSMSRPMQSNIGNTGLGSLSHSMGYPAGSAPLQPHMSDSAQSAGGPIAPPRLQAAWEALQAPRGSPSRMFPGSGQLPMSFGMGQLGPSIPWSSGLSAATSADLGMLPHPGSAGPIGHGWQPAFDQPGGVSGVSPPAVTSGQWQPGLGSNQSGSGGQQRHPATHAVTTGHQWLPATASGSGSSGQRRHSAPGDGQEGIVDLTDDTVDRGHSAASRTVSTGHLPHPHQQQQQQQRVLPNSLMRYPPQYQQGAKRRPTSPLHAEPAKRLPSDVRQLQVVTGQPQGYPAAQPLTALLRGQYAGNNGQAMPMQLSAPHPSRTVDPTAYNLPQALQNAARRLPPSLASASERAAALAGSSVDTLQTMQALVAGMQSAGDEEREPPPKALMVSMMHHQKLALAWMCNRESCRKPCGGILADDQGLGKTVTTIALMLTNPPDYHAAPKGKSRLKTGGSPTGASQDSSDLSSSSASLDDAALLDTDISPAETPGATPAQSQAADGDFPLCEAASVPGSQAEAGGMAGPSGVEGAGPANRPSGTSGIAADAGARAGPSSSQGAAAEQEAGPSGASRDTPQQRAGTLVVCPTSVLHQWAREMSAKIAPRVGWRVYIYHGKEKDVTPASLASYNAVLTTYGSMALEAPARERLNLKIKKQGTANVPIDLCEMESDGEGQRKGGKAKGKGRGKRDAAGGPLYQVVWHRVVLDEAQAIKNARTLAAHAAWALHAERRWCLSGTPIQNSVEDLFPLFRFLRYDPFSSARVFKDQIKDAITNSPQLGFKRLQAILQPILLRRTKTTKINGQPIVNIPAREQQLLKRSFNAAEAQLYTQVQAEGKAQLQALSGAGASTYINMLHSLLRLRQACNHPWLVKGSSYEPGKSKPPSASELAAVRKLPEPQRLQLLSMVDAGGGCPACGDVAEDPLVAGCGHMYCRQCVAAQLEGGDAGEFLCTACGVLLRQADLFSVAALTAVARPADAADAGTSSSGQRPWVSSSKVDALLEVLDAIRARNGAAAVRPQAEGNPLAVKSRTSAALAAAAFRKPPPVQAQAPVARGGKPEKVIVFSQWTSMLDLLEIPLKKAQYVFRRLDGTMTIQQRERAIQDFEAKPEVLVLIVSLKAAALGVNLTSANHVVLLDLWWNPTTEEQAIDRAHRIGQTRTVHVTRITVAGTVEERILELQEKKRQLVAAALTEGREAGQEGAKLTMDDLRFLFQGVF